MICATLIYKVCIILTNKQEARITRAPEIDRDLSNLFVGRYCYDQRLIVFPKICECCVQDHPTVHSDFA